MPKKKTKLTTFNVQDYLKDEKSIEAYLNEVFDDPESTEEEKGRAFINGAQAYMRLYGFDELICLGPWPSITALASKAITGNQDAQNAFESLTKWMTRFNPKEQ